MKASTKNLLSAQRYKQLQDFVQKLAINISDFNILNMALTHGSYVKENRDKKLKDNERLEFFGDAVLKLCISEYLMNKYKKYSEGELSNLRAFIVSEKVLIKVSNKLKIKDYLLVGKNEKKNLPKSIQADSVEALLAVIYYDCGIEVVNRFILKHWMEHIEYADKNKEKENYKAVLQEYTQSHSSGLPTYKTVGESGPEHQKVFEVAVFLGKEEMARGKGNTKKEASQAAAKKAVVKIKKTNE